MEILKEEKPKFEFKTPFMTGEGPCHLTFFEDHVKVYVDSRDATVKIEYEQIAQTAINFIKKPWKPTIKDQNEPRKKRQFTAEDLKFHTFLTIAKVCDVSYETIRRFINENKKDYPMLSTSNPKSFSMEIGRKIIEDYSIHRSLVKEANVERISKARAKKKKLTN